MIIGRNRRVYSGYKVKRVTQSGMREWTERENQSYVEFQIQRGCRIGEKTIESDGA